MDSFNAVYIMFVFGVKYRIGLIAGRWESQLYSVIGQLAKNCNCQPLAIGGMKDHVHVLVSVGGNAPAISEVIKYIKSGSSKWINDNKLFYGKFAWQEGSGKFSYSYRELPAMTKYINDQKLHHGGMTYAQEYERLLRANGKDVNAYSLPSALE